MFITLRPTFLPGEKSLETNLMSTGWKVSTHSLPPRTRAPAVAQESQHGRKPSQARVKDWEFTPEKEKVRQRVPGQQDEVGLG